MNFPQDAPGCSANYTLCYRLSKCWRSHRST